MLKNKVFGTFESDMEFQLVHFAMMPLYSENFDANAGLSSCLDNVYNSEAHSMIDFLSIYWTCTLDLALTIASRRSLL